MTSFTTAWLLMVIAVLALNVTGSARRHRVRRRRATPGTSAHGGGNRWTYSDGSYSGYSDSSSWSSTDSGSSWGSSDCGSSSSGSSGSDGGSSCS